MSSPATPPPIPTDPNSGQWAYPTDAQGEPKKKYVLWIVIGAAGCFVLVVVVGVLATLIVPNVVRGLESAKRAATRTELHHLYAALLEYGKAHGGQYPESLDALVQPDEHGHTLLDDKRKLPRDLWGHEFAYEPPTHENQFPVVYSFGRDGRPGGVGPDADIHEVPEPGEER